MVKCKRLVFGWLGFFPLKSITLTLLPPPKKKKINTLIARGLEQPGLVEGVMSHGTRVVERDYLRGSFQPKPFMTLSLINPRASRLTPRKSQLSWRPGCEVSNLLPFPFNPEAGSGEWKLGHACCRHLPASCAPRGHVTAAPSERGE